MASNALPIIVRSRISDPEAGDRITLDDSTTAVWIYNRDAIREVGVLYGGSGVTMDATLTEALTIIPPGVGLPIMRPGRSARKAGDATHVYVRTTNEDGTPATLDVHELAEI